MSDKRLESLLSGLGMRRIEEWAEASPYELYRLGENHKRMLRDALKQISESRRAD